MCLVLTSRPEGPGFESKLNQIDDLRIVYVSLPDGPNYLDRVKDWFVQSQDNVTE